MNESIFDLVEHTQRSIFLTGKAGTGKTTFLNNFIKKTQKKYIVVAPTGIAAINAGGVTVHSMFGLPLRTFIPTLDRIDQNMANNIPDLMHHFKYRKDKLKLLREIEIIIIDEVSMLRADVLDMMDFSLRHVRRNQQPFGGVQMLFIGDLYQLPPVVRDEFFLKKYYPSPFFFDSYALKQVPLVTLELTKVYRQKDENFLQILNAIRDGNRDDIDFDTLNQRYDPNFRPSDEAYVYLTSHNRMADDINQRELKALPGKSYHYDAKVIGEFKETQYPNELVIELRVGSQIMFIRNDASPDKRYYNGKLAEVIRLDEDEIWVRIDGDDEDYKLKQEVWEQKAYSLDAEKNIKEDVLGSFEQYPIRLAWAVTIHKSQGLTFDRLIIDAGKSFASGQVYVALSRCRTLEGIVLKSKITPDAIFSDHRVYQFQDSTNANEQIEQILQSEKYDYSIKKVLRYVNPYWLQATLDEWHQQALSSKNIDREKVKQLYFQTNKDVKKLLEIYVKFEKIVLQKTYKFTQTGEDWNEIEAKAEGAVTYFLKQINEHLFSPFKSFYAETKGVKGLKQYNEITKTFIDDLQDYLTDLKAVHLLGKPMFDQSQDIQITANVAKIPSHVVTYQLFEQGMSVSEIAKERGLVLETIFGHLAKFAEQGLVDISHIVAKDNIKIFESVFKINEFETLTEWRKALPPQIEFHEIRLLLNHFQAQKRVKERKD